MHVAEEAARTPDQPGTARSGSILAARPENTQFRGGFEESELPRLRSEGAPHAKAYANQNSRSTETQGSSTSSRRNTATRPPVSNNWPPRGLMKEERPWLRLRYS